MTRAVAYGLVGVVRLIADGPLLWMLVFLYSARQGSGGLADAAFNLVVFTAFAVTHSALTTPGLKHRLGHLVGADHVRFSHVLVAGVSLALVLLLWRPLRGRLWEVGGATAWVLTAGFVGSLAAIVVAASSIDYLDFIGVRRWLRRVQHRPDRAPVLSIAGPYAHVRHPMYAALVGALWIGPVMSYTRLEFAALATLYLLVGTRHEERNLRLEFGASYDAYRAHVPMWLPRLTPWRPGHG